MLPADILLKNVAHFTSVNHRKSSVKLKLILRQNSKKNLKIKNLRNFFHKFGKVKHYAVVNFAMITKQKIPLKFDTQKKYFKIPDALLSPLKNKKYFQGIFDVFIHLNIFLRLGIRYAKIFPLWNINFTYFL